MTVSHVSLSNTSNNTNTPAKPYSGIDAERVEINWAVSVEDFGALPWMDCWCWDNVTITSRLF